MTLIPTSPTAAAGAKVNKACIAPKTVEAKGNQYTIREMTVDDYPPVRKLVPGVSTCDLHHSPEYFATLLQLPTYYPFVLSRNDTGEVIGFAELILLPHIGRTCDSRLERVIVQPQYRGQGLATALCVRILEVAEALLGCNRCDLTVEKPDARHIYQNKLGFTPVTTEVMRLRLPRLPS